MFYVWNEISCQGIGECEKKILIECVIGVTLMCNSTTTTNYNKLTLQRNNSVTV